MRRIFGKPFLRMGYVEFCRKHGLSPRRRIKGVKKPVQRRDGSRRIFWPWREGSNYKCLAWAFRGPWKAWMDSQEV